MEGAACPFSDWARGRLRRRSGSGSRNWPELRAGLSKYSGHDLTSLIGNISAKLPEMSDWLPEAVGPESDDALGLALLGDVTIERAWRVRTASYAQHVSKDQFRDFHKLLREAEAHLYRSAELDPKSAAPWYPLLISGRGLEVGLDVQQRHSESLIERSPGHLGAHK